MKSTHYYLIIDIYKNLIRKKDKRGEDTQELKKRLLAIMIKHGKNKSTHSV
jgi:hypothetical protein